MDLDGPGSQLGSAPLVPRHRRQLLSLRLESPARSSMTDEQLSDASRELDPEEMAIPHDFRPP